MLRIITGFILLIISQISFADTIAATPSSTTTEYGVNGYTSSSQLSACQMAVAVIPNHVSPGDILNGKCHYFYDSRLWFEGNISISVFTTTIYSCLSGYFLSDSSGHSDSAGTYCTKSPCADYAGTSIQLWFARNSVPTTGCYAGCTATSTVAVNYGATNVEMPYVYQTFTLADKVCTGSMSYTDAATAQAANAAAQSQADQQKQKDACGDAGYDMGTVNGQTIITCKAPNSTPSTDTATNNNTSTDTANNTTTNTTTNTTINTTTNTSTNTTTNNSTTTGTGTAGTGTAGTGTAGTGTAGTGTDSGSSSGSGSGASGSGTGSGTGAGSGSGAGSATSGAGGTDSGTPAEEEEESGDGGGSFSDPAKGKDYFSDLFGSTDLQALADKKTTIQNSISAKKAEIKSVFKFNGISMSGSLSENQQEIKGATIDLSGKSTFDRFTYIAAILYLTAIIIAIWIVLGGKK